jgi:hypothetical protein
MFVDRRPRVGQIGSVANQRGMSSRKGVSLTHMPRPVVTMDIGRPSSTASVIDIAGNVTAACEDMLMDAYSQAADRDTRAIGNHAGRTAILRKHYEVSGLRFRRVHDERARGSP